MRVFVTGGTGAIGSSTVPALVAAGHQVTAVSRSSDRADWLIAKGATPVTVDLLDSEAVTAAVDGHQVICNFASHCPSFTHAIANTAWRENDRLRQEGSRIIVDAARATGVERIVQGSSTLLYPDRGDEWIDEYAGTAPGEVTLSMIAAEENINSFADHGGVGVSLRMGDIYGPENEATIAALEVARRWRSYTGPGSPHGYMSMIHEDDIGSAVVAALEAPTGAWNLVDDQPITRREFIGLLAEAVGRSKLFDAGRILMGVAGQQLEVASRSHRVSNRLFRGATGWVPRYATAVEGFAAMRSGAGARATARA